MSDSGVKGSSVKGARERDPALSPHEKIAEQRKDPQWRDFAGRVAQETAERAAASGGLEEKLADVANLQPTQVGLPVQYVDDYVSPKRRLLGKRAPVVRGATAGDIQNYAQAPTRVCGTCRHFQLERGRREIAKQRFLERLVLEEDWKLSHLGAPADHMGICGEKPTMATSTVTNASSCPAYQPRDGIYRRHG